MQQPGPGSISAHISSAPPNGPSAWLAMEQTPPLTRLTVEPCDANRLDEHSKQDGRSRRKVVQECEHIHASLETRPTQTHHIC